jgi:hypothetical protein
MDAITEIHQKIPTELSIRIDTDKPIALVNSADWQLGQFGVDYDSFYKDIEFLCTEGVGKCKVSVGGDGYQNIIQPSKMGSSHNQIPICNQKGLYVLTNERLIDAGVLLAIGTGNHNYWTTLADGEDWDGELVRRFRVKQPNLIYTKHGAMIHLQVGEMVYPMWREHAGPYESSFNPTHGPRQSQRVHHPGARIIIREHKHVGEMLQYRYDGLECVAIRPGTYSVYDDFAQQWGFYGAHVCNPTVVLWPYEDRLVGFKDMRDAFIYLRGLENENICGRTVHKGRRGAEC